MLLILKENPRTCAYGASVRFTKEAKFPEQLRVIIHKTHPCRWKQLQTASSGASEGDKGTFQKAQSEPSSYLQVWMKVIGETMPSVWMKPRNGLCCCRNNSFSDSATASMTSYISQDWNNPIQDVKKLLWSSDSAHICIKADTQQETFSTVLY